MWPILVSVVYFNPNLQAPLNSNLNPDLKDI